MSVEKFDSGDKYCDENILWGTYCDSHDTYIQFFSEYTHVLWDPVPWPGEKPILLGVLCGMQLG